MPKSDKQMLHDIMMVMINHGIADYQELQETPKMELVDMLDEVCDACDYYNFALENKVFTN